MAQQVNLSDVAEATGVSRATVSKALNGWPDVSASTRQRIIRVARKLNYPLGQVRSGRRAAGKRIQRVGLVCFDHTIEEMLANQTYRKLITGVQEEAAAHNDELIMEFGVEDLPRCYQDTRVDALLVIGRPSAGAVNSLKDLPVVCSPNQVPGTNCSVVLQDSRGGAAMAARLLIERGHEQIAFVSHAQRAGAFLDRRGGYEEAMHLAGIEPIVITDERYIFQNFDLCNDLVRRVLDSKVTAIVAGNDYCAMSLIHVLGQLGHDVPRDISVVGFDHGGAGSLPWPVPELTTIDGRMRQVGREAMRLLSRLQPEEQHTPLCVTVGAQLVAGETVAAPRDR